MQIQNIIADIGHTLTDTFHSIDTWFDKEEALRHYQPANGGWTINQVLEHIALTNHFLLILINKATSKALQNVHKLDLEEAIRDHVFHFDQLTEVGLHNSFQWVRPGHMEPKGAKPLAEVRVQLKEQMVACLESLDKLKNGEGVLYNTTMTVNNLGKINVYEYIYFLAQHGRRHITQMEKVEREYKSKSYSI